MHIVCSIARFTHQLHLVVVSRPGICAGIGYSFYCNESFDLLPLSCHILHSDFTNPILPFNDLASQSESAVMQ